MKTRGKKLVVTHPGDAPQSLESILYAVLETAGRTLANTDIGFRARLSARKTLRQAAEAWAIYERDKLNQKQRGAGSAGKLNPAQRERMREQYAARVRDGQKYGAIKYLENTFGVDRRTVHSVLKKEK